MAYDSVNNAIVPVVGVSTLELPDPNKTSYNPGTLNFQFNRSWLVSFSGIGPAVGPPPPPSPSSYNSLRTLFEIEKTAASTANKGKISLYNLDNVSRQNYLKGTRMSLAVGYGGPGGITIPIFSNAAIWRVHHERKGPDIISSFESGEGESELQASIFNQSFPAGTPVTTVIAAIISAMGLVQGPVVGLKPLVYNNGTSFSGSCKAALDRVITKDLKLNWWIQGFAVLISPSGSASIVGAVPVNVTTGLIGTPNVGQGQGGDNVLTFTSLINPFLVPGTPVTISSTFVTGSAVVKLAKFEGDTHTSKWTVTCECTPISLTGLNDVTQV